MALFIKALAVSLVAAVLVMALEKQGKDMAILLTIAACCMVISVGISYLRPVVTFLSELQEIGGLNEGMTAVLFKTLGVGILTEVAAMVCSDAGNASLAKGVHFLGSMGVLWLALPIFAGLVELIQSILVAR